MKKIVSELFMTLDGVVAEPGKWHSPFHDPEMDRAIEAGMAAADTMLLGRRTYEEHAGYWPAATGSMADLMNGLPKVVLSTTLTAPKWKNTSLITTFDEVANLKEAPGDGPILITGSPTLVRALLRNGLLDELRLLIDPVVTGTGARLFEDRPLGFERVATEAFPSGSLSVTYAVAR
ncbi:dihydrofolate reductase family protein [Actinomadura barringtoniae]|uniref:Dihydrofolate reductase family protein n=1 Tax=Actinomadura barringtoniae TaxID=1427535 RepID=A0A939PAR0_9ACTN|nr:dihydrofolate reductase family protein [Actinomadura barringtoniae]MBO2448978.1 dihydrofolate reductase family protein [Actinomadura barringtoniae]